MNTLDSGGNNSNNNNISIKTKNQSNKHHNNNNNSAGAAGVSASAAGLGHGIGLGGIVGGGIGGVGGGGGGGGGAAFAASCQMDPALPTQFVLSMKTLFDILDDQQTGFVKFSDIEKGWQDERCIELLRRVTPASGLLSFERFCGGLKLCLLKNQQEATTANAPIAFGSIGGGGGGSGMHKPVNINPINNHSNNSSNNKQHSYYGVKACKAPIKLAARPPSAPMLEIENPLPSSIWGNGAGVATAAATAATIGGGGMGLDAMIGGMAAASMHATSHMVASKSMPQLSPDSEESEGDLIDSRGSNNKSGIMGAGGGVVGSATAGIGGGGGGGGVRAVSVYHSPPPPPKPPRAAAVKLQAATHSVNPINAAAGHGNAALLKTVPVSSNKAEIRNALQNWQMNILLSEMDTSKDKQKSTFATSTATATTAAAAAYMPAQYPYRRGCADGGSSSATESASSANGHATIPPPARKSNSKRRDSRRHTLQNGIDYNMMMRRLKQLEEEREMLLLALNAVDRARDCYVQQVAHVQEKIKYLGLMGNVEQWSEEAQQERLNYQRARILDVNRCLAALAETCYPMHLNLAFSGESNKNTTSASYIRSPPLPPPPSQTTKICDADVVY